MQSQYVPVRAEIVADEEFSVHADADVLVAWLREMPEPPETVDVTPGEQRSTKALADRIPRKLDVTAVVPRLGERVRLR